MYRIILILLIIVLLGCGGGSDSGRHLPPPPPGTTFDFDFANDAQAWVAGFAEYPVGQEQFFQLDSGIRSLPSPLDATRSGFMLSGNNHSDDLFMFLKKQVSGLKPNTNYSVIFGVEFGTNVGKGCFGEGGSPGSSVFVKAGATLIEPQRVVVDGSGGLQSYRLNIDKGNQSQGGKDAIVLGDFANDTECDSNSGYRLKALQNYANSFKLLTDSTGSAWLLVGTDSGYEGTTTIYYKRIRATFQDI